MGARRHLSSMVTVMVIGVERDAKGVPGVAVSSL